MDKKELIEVALTYYEDAVKYISKEDCYTTEMFSYLERHNLGFGVCYWAKYELGIKDLCEEDWVIRHQRRNVSWDWQTFGEYWVEPIIHFITKRQVLENLNFRINILRNEQQTPD